MALFEGAAIPKRRVPKFFNGATLGLDSCSRISIVPVLLSANNNYG